MTKASGLMLFWEIIAVYYENDTTCYKYIVWAKWEFFFNFKASGAYNNYSSLKASSKLN
jgi:hypothetical protein